MERDPAESETVQQTVQHQRRARVGVTLIKPRGETRTGWRLRWTDPDTGTVRTRSLTSTEAQTKTAREETVRKLTRELRRRKDELEQGAARHRESGLTTREALDGYFVTKRLAPKTRAEYRYVADAFVTWAEAQGLRNVRDINKGALHGFSVSRGQVLKRSAKPTGRRGERYAAGVRSTHTANKERRALSAILGYLRKADILRISSDDIADGLARDRARVERKDFLQALQVRHLLKTAQAHDAETFALTRGGSETTPRYKPIAPLVRALLLTGLRIGEALALLWSDVHGDKVYLRAETVKTGSARTIDLTVSPTALPSRLGAGRVFDLTAGEINAARKRLIARGAPAFTWHTLRRTSGTFLTCAPGIYAGASAYMSAARLGHSVTVAEKHYVGQVSVPLEARTLEAAFGIAEPYVIAAGALERATAALAAEAAENTGKPKASAEELLARRLDRILKDHGPEALRAALDRAKS